MMLPTQVLDRDAERPVPATPARSDEGWPSRPSPAAASTAAEDRLRRLIDRARSEFAEMPGLRLTVAQAARLWALDTATSAAMLAALVRAGFLMKQGERYSRAGSA